MIEKLNYLFVTLFGIGKISKIPGSIASLATTIFLFFLFHIFNVEPDIMLIVIVVIFLVSLYSVNIFIKNLDDKDPKEIVIDEFIGQSIPICLYEIAHEGVKETNDVLTFYFIMFILFRIFDITKPYPVSYYDKNFKNSFGVVMDDVCAGLYVVGILVLYMVFSSWINFLKELLNYYKKKKLKISFAESCTGGLLASTITKISGSSKIFTLGLVTYSNQAKINILKVPNKIIKKYGAVSYETCVSMVKNLKKISKTNISVSITGVAGPKGGTKEKPVGLVYIGIKKNSKTIVKKHFFKNKKRNSIQKTTVKEALKLILSITK